MLQSLAVLYCTRIRQESDLDPTAYGFRVLL
jgi:hypothetical protein